MRGRKGDVVFMHLFSNPGCCFFPCVFGCLKGVREQLMPSAHISTCVSRDRFRRYQKFNGVSTYYEAQKN